MITFSDDDEAFLDRVCSPPVTPTLPDDEQDETSKTLWYHDKSTHDDTVTISLRKPHGKYCFYAGETIEVDVTCTVRQLQLLSGVLEGFCVLNGQVEETLVFHEVRLFANQQSQVPAIMDAPLRKSSDDGKKRSASSNNTCAKHFKFSMTVPLSAPPSIKISSKTGIFYRIRVCGIGEVPYYHVLPHHHFQGILTPTKELSSPHIGGLGNYVPLKVRNNTCGYVNKHMICDKPQTTFSVVAPVSGKDLTLKVYLVGSPYATLGQQFTCFVTVDNATYKYSKGFTIKLVRHVSTVSTCSAFMRGTDEEDAQSEKCKTLLKLKFHSAEYHCSPKGKLQSQLAFRIPHTLTPTIVTDNLSATYGLLVRVDISPTSGLAQEMPLLILPCALESTRNEG